MSSAEPLRDRPNRALLLIDFQRDFLDQAGRMPVARNQVEPVVLAARAAIAAARSSGMVIVRIGNEFRPSDHIGNLLRRRAAIAGSGGAAWDGRLEAAEAVYLPKWKTDAFCNPALAALLAEQAIGEVVLAGLFARACVSATAKGALARGLSVQVLEPAVACSSDRSREAALRLLAALGVQVTTALPA